MLGHSLGRMGGQRRRTCDQGGNSEPDHAACGQHAATDHAACGQHAATDGNGCIHGVAVLTTLTAAPAPRQ